MLRATDLNLVPAHEVVNCVVMQAGPANVDTVMIAGEIKKRNGKLLTAGVAQKQAKLVDSGQRIVSEFAAL